MFSFIPLLLIILSLAGIIWIVLRRTENLGEALAQTSISGWPGIVKKFLIEKIWPGMKAAGRKLWHYILEVKGLSKAASSHFPKALPKIHLPKTRLPFLTHQNPAEVYLKKAEESMAREDFEDAERQLIRAIEKDPNSQPAYEALGKMYMAQKKFEDAIDTYKYLIKHFPDNDGYFSSLGQAYHNQKLYDQAIEVYERAIELNPAVASRYLNLGLTLEAKRHLEEGILNYKRAIELEPENTHFLIVLVEALIKKQDKEEAELILERILQLEPTNHLAREKLMQLKF